MIKTIEFTTYTYLASYLVNGDASGLETDDLSLARTIEQALARKGYWVSYALEDVEFGSPDYGKLPGEICTFVAIQAHTHTN